MKAFNTDCFGMIVSFDSPLTRKVELTAVAIVSANEGQELVCQANYSDCPLVWFLIKMCQYIFASINVSTLLYHR